MGAPADLVRSVLPPQAADRARRAWRGLRVRSMSRLRPGSLPSFLIIGTMRGGTTSLYQDLAEHPDTRLPLGKELQYFSLFHRRGIHWYAGHFPPTREGQQAFEASPLYLFHPEAPARVAAALPDVRLVALLRDPVERAFSHHQHSVRLGHETLGFADALAAEPERMARGRELGWDHAEGLRLMRHHSYLARGRYAEQLERWFAVLPPEQFHIVRSEAVHAAPEAEHARLLQFLGLAPHRPASFAQHTRNPGGSKIPQDLVERLRAEFEPDVERLRPMLGWDRAWWVGDRAPERQNH